MERQTTRARSRVYFIGTDEAGYGPNLGPLLVGASCWSMTFDEAPLSNPNDFLPPARSNEENESAIELKAKKKGKKKSVDSDAPSLFDFVSEPEDKPRESSENGALARDLEFTRRAIERLNAELAPISDRKGIFPLVDSKKLYGGSKSLAALERSFWLANGALDLAAWKDASFRSALARVARETPSNVEPWEDGVDFAAPLDPKTGPLDGLKSRLDDVRERFETSGVALVDLAARRVHAREFNALVDRLGLKSDLIADVTTSLVVETIARVCADQKNADAPLLFAVLCDKLGGRDRYAATLTARFPECELRALAEGRAESVYRLTTRWGKDRSGALVDFGATIAIEIRFSAKGESNAPTALASICAKYLRELSMKAFNDYWRAEVGPELAPTAGYPVDALRFRADVEDARTRLNVPDSVFWRKK